MNFIRIQATADDWKPSGWGQSIRDAYTKQGANMERLDNGHELNTPHSSQVSRGFPGLTCLNCGEHDILVYASSLNYFHCGSCDVEYHRSEVERTLSAWQEFLAWIDKAPVLEEE